MVFAAKDEADEQQQQQRQLSISASMEETVPLRARRRSEGFVRGLLSPRHSQERRTAPVSSAAAAAAASAAAAATQA